jgi:hypothetical protein
VTIGYDEVVGHTEGKKKKNTSIFYFHETTPKDLISYLKPQFEIFLLHNFWLDAEFKEFIKTMSERCVISCVNLLKNYTIKA